MSQPPHQNLHDAAKPFLWGGTMLLILGGIGLIGLMMFSLRSPHAFHRGTTFPELKALKASHSSWPPRKVSLSPRKCSSSMDQQI